MYFDRSHSIKLFPKSPKPTLEVVIYFQLSLKYGARITVMHTGSMGFVMDMRAEYGNNFGGKQMKMSQIMNLSLLLVLQAGIQAAGANGAADIKTQAATQAAPEVKAAAAQQEAKLEAAKNGGEAKAAAETAVAAKDEKIAEKSSAEESLLDRYVLNPIKSAWCSLKKLIERAI